MKKIITYLRPLWEGKDNKPSIRRIFAFAFLVGIIRMIEKSYVKDCTINTEALMWLCTTLLVLLGLTTWQNLKEQNGTNNTGTSIEAGIDNTGNPDISTSNIRNSN